ncbi:hypothetical protein FNF27_02443 [Cafeteria roenbergensis]|uniref:Protein CASP n=1 Tax=Cafeteria roenbergensis TaxID=33653 RepID=A0A5A8DQ07_CAFRO|nr:hypothetical protein FNF29_04430 [Cafeteria roenbergensis]KAA0167462.1 hypothetical protein FNF31_00901 [Cafeteria roenbergensis]KAA0176051.1 hypothetical protein FNF27_02443 [Cafeteria roenbergensis]|eukprot:KAA0151746.1 hypothetical protein FNF29_04430 [Cafeteria roenbergensis]
MAQAAAGDSRAGEGVRMRRLRDTLSKALDECFRTVELSTFHQALPTIARKHQAAVDELGIGVLDTLRKNVEAEFETICASADVAAKLNLLDELVAGKAGSAGRPSGLAVPAASENAPRLLANHILRERLLQQAKTLKASLEELEAGNEALEAEVAAMDSEVRTISSGAKDSVRALEEAGEVAEEFQKEREAATAAAAAPGTA